MNIATDTAMASAIAHWLRLLPWPRPVYGRVTPFMANITPYAFWAWVDLETYCYDCAFERGKKVALWLWELRTLISLQIIPCASPPAQIS